MNFMTSSNPALSPQNLANARNPYAYDEAPDGQPLSASVSRPTTATVQGVINKTAMFTAIAVAGGFAGAALVSIFPGIMWITAIAAMIVVFGMYFVVTKNPGIAMVIGPVYALIEGVFLGAFTVTIDSILVSQGINIAGGVALPAFIITISIMLSMLALYYARILRPTKMFVSIVSTATLGIFIMYMLGFVLMLFGGPTLPFIGLNEAFTGGTPALIGLGVNLLILGVASMWFIIDFGMIDDAVSSGAPKKMEWFLAFALLVTLAWVYYEAVKIVFRLAMLFGNRD